MITFTITIKQNPEDGAIDVKAMGTNGDGGANDAEADVADAIVNAISGSKVGDWKVKQISKSNHREPYSGD